MSINSWDELLAVKLEGHPGCYAYAVSIDLRDWLKPSSMEIVSELHLNWECYNLL